jgi:hypothetical protein
MASHCGEDWLLGVVVVALLTQGGWGVGHAHHDYRYSTLWAVAILEQRAFRVHGWLDGMVAGFFGGSC